ncbi:hypothetical protein [Legionella shakespearei]|uniref:Uncharacterized protein n=1 Tax=Legionella shakespearei DSM 23087 TaxID=1122169 RepID=A0A0W0ZAA7_9GAMM|nr:hypothetical protein [Legionella shakespearei]KTD65977.1 hypothetical protein Lsha_0184 [Legionella shakespearei DSM 23087]
MFFDLYYSGQRFPDPHRLWRYKKRGDDQIFVESTMDTNEYYVVSFHVTQAMEQLQASVQGIQDGLLRILPALFNNQSVKTTPFPSLTLPNLGTMVLPSPVAAYPKLTKAKNDYPTFGSVRHSLPGDVVTGNNDGLLKKVKQLQEADQPVFSEFFNFFTSNWDVVSELYQEKYHISLPAPELLKDKSGNYDSEKFSTFFFDPAFLTRCVVRLITQGGDSEFHPVYGLGLELILKGRLDLLKTIVVNDKLHPFDAQFLKFVLPNILKVSLDGTILSPPWEGFSSVLDDSSFSAYFEGVIHFLWYPHNEPFTDMRLAELDSLYQQMNKFYYFAVLTRNSSVPEIGDRCLVRFYTANSFLDSEQKKQNMIFVPGLETDEDNSPFIRLGSDQAITSYFKQGSYRLTRSEGVNVPSFDSALLNPILGYFMGLLIQVPQAKLAAKAGVIGPLLRSIFPHTRLDLLTLPLSDSMRELATTLFQTPASSALPQALQSYHLPQILPPETLKSGQVQLLPEGFVNLGSGSASGKIYQGSHDVFNVVPLAKSAKKSVHETIQDIYGRWHRVFGFEEQVHPIYGAIEEAPYSDSSLPDANVRLHMTPNTVSVRQDKSDLVYYPVAMRDKGLYVSLTEGPDLKRKEHSTRQNIASGCCLLGNDFVGHCETEEGMKTYCLLDAHQEPPQGNIVDVSFNFPEHPEETMYLALQKTLGPFFRDTHPGQELNFYYHDLRKAYLFYLLPHYLRGTMSREVLLKGAAIIEARHEQMVGKLSDILSASRIKCESFSSLQILQTEALLNQIDALRDSPLDNKAKEALLVRNILQFMASDSSVPESTKTVYNHILTQEKLLEELIGQSGLHTIAILDYMVQFAVLNQNSEAPLLVALPSVEYKLLKNYEAYFGKAFGSVVHFLWMNPVNLRDDSKHNRLFFVGDHIPEYQQLLEDTLEPVQELIKHQALDEPEGVVADVKNISAKIAQLPYFFSKAKVPESKTGPDEALAKKPESPKV